jgi:hypothetical protein
MLAFGFVPSSRRLVLNSYSLLEKEYEHAELAKICRGVRLVIYCGIEFQVDIPALLHIQIVFAR